MKSWNFRGMCYIKAMDICSLSWKKYVANQNSTAKKAKQNTLILLSNCVIALKRNSTFIKNQELSNDLFKMNKIINIFLLTPDQSTP